MENRDSEKVHGGGRPTNTNTESRTPDYYLLTMGCYQSCGTEPPCLSTQYMRLVPNVPQAYILRILLQHLSKNRTPHGIMTSELALETFLLVVYLIAVSEDSRNLFPLKNNKY